jgi:hypothetical protein
MTIEAESGMRNLLTERSNAFVSWATPERNQDSLVLVGRDLAAARCGDFGKN